MHLRKFLPPLSPSCVEKCCGCTYTSSVIYFAKWNIDVPSKASILLTTCFTDNSTLPAICFSQDVWRDKYLKSNLAKRHRWMCHPGLSWEPSAEEQGTSPRPTLSHPHIHTETHTHRYTVQYTCRCTYLCSPSHWWGERKPGASCLAVYMHEAERLQSKHSRCVRWESCRLSARDSLQLHDHTHTNTHTHGNTHSWFVCECGFGRN